MDRVQDFGTENQVYSNVQEKNDSRIMKIILSFSGKRVTIRVARHHGLELSV